MSDAPPDSDRREGLRHFSCFPAHIEQDDGPRTAIIRDVSVTGAHLVTRAKLAEGQVVKLALYITTDVNHPRSVMGKVVRFESRLEDRSDWPYSVGIRFDEPLLDCEEEIKSLAEKQEKLFGTKK
jgi:hypothetical protein